MSDKAIPARGLRRHLDGWQGVVIAVAIAGIGIAIGAPRAVPPIEVPLPVANPTTIERERVADLARAASFAHIADQDRDALFDLRALGDALRRFGEADLAGKSDERALIRPQIIQLMHDMQEPAQVERILALRAYQLEVFLRGLSAWEVTGELSPEARAVGGDFLGIAKENGWIEQSRKLSMNETVRAALFKRRFNEIVAVQNMRFALSLDEMREMYSFWLTNPPRSHNLHPDSSHKLLDWELAKVTEIGGIDPVYPGDLAKGVVHFQQGDMRDAIRDFQSHLSKHPDGPYTLRARNYLVAALETDAP